MLKTLATTTMAFCFVAGAAIAQTSGGATDNPAAAPSESAPADTNSQATGSSTAFKSDAERAMYESNMAAMGTFFTDDTMTTLKSDAEVKSAFEAMDAEGQAGMKSACQKADEDRGSYGTVTTTLCSQVMAM